MLKIKQYINNNRQLFLMLFTLTPFLIIYSVAYCNPMLIMAVLPSISNKVIDKVFDVAPYFADKAIAATPYVAYGTGWVVVGSALTLTSIKAAEYSYNWRYLANQTTSNIPVVGWMVSWSASSLQWCYEKLTNTKIEPVEYTYFYPKIASALGDPKFFTKKLIFDLSNQSVKISTDKDLERVVEKTKYEFIDRVERQIEYRDRPVYTPVTEYVEKPVYVAHPVYRDRENLLILGEKIDKLTYVTNESNLAHIGLHNGYAQLKDEIVLLVDSNKKKNANLQKIAFFGEESLGIYYEYSDGSKLAVTKTDFQYRFLLTMFNTFVEYNQSKYGFFRPEEQEKMYNCPTIELSYSNATFFNSSQLQLDKTLVTRIFCQDNMFLFDQGVNFFMENNADLQRIQTDQQKLTCELRQKVNDGLLIKETTNHGTQTLDFSINDMFFDEISSYLETQDQTSFIVASQGGQNLPFNELNACNTHAGIEMMKKYNEAKKAKIAKTQEISVQTEPMVHENTEILGINSVNSSVFQNMGALFSAALVWSIAHDFQTLDLVARSLLGFIHIPEYNQAFIAATQMSVVDLQMEYGFTLDDARRAYDSIEYANTMRTTGSLPDDLSSSLSNSNDYLDQTQKSVWSWKDYLLLTSGLIIAGSTLYYMYQSVKVGIPADSIQDISPNVEAWKNSLYDKINKL